MQKGKFFIKDAPVSVIDEKSFLVKIGASKHFLEFSIDEKNGDVFVSRRKALQDVENTLISATVNSRFFSIEKASMCDKNGNVNIVSFSGAKNGKNFKTKVDAENFSLPVLLPLPVYGGFRISAFFDARILSFILFKFHNSSSNAEKLIALEVLRSYVHTVFSNRQLLILNSLAAASEMENVIGEENMEAIHTAKHGNWSVRVKCEYNPKNMYLENLNILIQKSGEMPIAVRGMYFEKDIVETVKEVFFQNIEIETLDENHPFFSTEDLKSDYIIGEEIRKNRNFKTLYPSGSAISIDLENLVADKVLTPGESAMFIADSILESIKAMEGVDQES